MTTFHTIVFENAGAAITEDNIDTQTFDNVTDIEHTGYTVGSGTNRLLLYFHHVVQHPSAADIALSSTCTYGGTSMTLAGGNVTRSARDSHVQIYYMVDADIPTGSNSFVMDEKNNGEYGMTVAMRLENVDQTTPIDVTATTADLFNDQTPQLAITTVTDGARIYAVCASNTLSDGVATSTPDSGAELYDFGSGTRAAATATALTKDPAGAETMGFSLSKQPGVDCMLNVAIRPA